MPSLRLLVARSDALSPLPARGFPLVVRGVQTFAHLPLHLLVVPVSFSNRYTVCLLGPMTTLPNDTLRSETFTPLGPAAEALLVLVDVVVGAPPPPPLDDELPDLLLLPHAPTAVARPTATTAAVKPR